MNFLSSLDFEKVGSKLASAVEEFPTEGAGARGGPAGRAGLRVASAHYSNKTYQAWDELDFEAKKQEWAELCEQLKANDTQAPPSAEQWQHRAKDAEYQLLRMCNVMLGLPDPLPLLASTAALSTKVAEVDAKNKELQAAADAAAADTTEITTLVEQHRALAAAHQQLQDSMAASEVELVKARAAAAEAANIKAGAEAQAAQMQRLQDVLRALRLEHERAQSSLFEFTNAQDQEMGGRQREMELANQELERTQQRAAELALERDTLQQRLEAAHEELEAVMAAAEGGGESEGRTRGESAQSEQEPSGVEGEKSHRGARHSRGKGQSGGGKEAGEGFWERQVRVRGEQVEELQAQLSQQQQELADAVSQHEMQVQSWSNRLAASELSVSKLQAELAKRPEPHLFQELSAQVAALRQLIDVQMESEGWGQEESLKGPLRTLGLDPSSTSQTVSSIQQARNRKLAADMSSLKRQLDAQCEAQAAAQREASVWEAKASAAVALADRLEGDLAAVRHGQISQGLSAKHTRESEGAPQQKGGQEANQLSSSASHVLQESVAHLSAPFNADGIQGAASNRTPEGQQLESSSSAVQGPSTPDSNNPSGSSSLLDIVISQRDRFRQRMGQLEDEKGALAEQLTQAQKQLDTCRSDNIALYEKVRFIEQYSQKGGQGGKLGAGGAGSKLHVVRVDGAGVPLQSEAEAEQRAAARYQCGPLAFEIGGGAADATSSGNEGAKGGSGVQGALSSGGVRARAAGPRKVQAFCFPSDDTPGDEETGSTEARYARAYEARVNPFTDFQNREMEARVRSLQPHDRAVLAGSKLLVGNRFARAFVAAYAVLLHLFIMALLYFAMLPSKHTVEMVDIGAVQQQQEAVKSSTGKVLLNSLLGHHQR